MKQVKLIMLITSILLVFVSCKSKESSIDQEKIKEYPVTIDYTYDFTFYKSGTKEIKNFSDTFTGYASDLKIKETTDNTVIVSAIVSNDYFTTNELELTYTFINSNNNFTITQVQCNDVPIVKPVLELDLDILYQKNLQMRINNKGIELTKENFPSIKLDVKCKGTTTTGSESVFSKSGMLILTNSKNEKYYTYVHITYNPNEYDDWTKEASWSLNESSYACYSYE